MENAPQGVNGFSTGMVFRKLSRNINFIMAAEEGISEEVKNFISKHIRSVEQLEILLLLSASPERIWTVQSVHQQIQSSQAAVAACLEKLHEQGFLTARKMPGLVYQYSPNSPELAKGVATLAATYKEKRIKVIEQIFEKSGDQLRNFLDAFKIRKDP
jgi:predicted transcriptional regulator